MQAMYTKKNKGFTLVETLVAISILSLSIAATFTAVQNGIQNSTIAKDQTIAFYLAQEAMEYIKNKRDNNALATLNNPDAPTNWLVGMSAVAGDPCRFDKVCRIDSPNKTIVECGSVAITSNPPNVCPNLKQEASSSLYGHLDGWTDTRFKREIQFQEVFINREVRVFVTVSWTSRGGTRHFQAVETLLNRQ